MTEFALYSIWIFLTAFIGGSLPLLFRRADENKLKLFVSLGAGVLLGMALLHIIPEASRVVPNTFGFWLLGGFVLMLVLERFIMVHACEEGHCDYHKVGNAAFVGLAVHGAIEGFALASSLSVSRIAPLVLVGILFHKAPAAFALTSILRMSGRSTRQILFFLLGTALASPLGILAGYVLIENARLPNAAGSLLGLSAGTFLYISACDLIPELHKSDTERLKRLVAFLIGILVCIFE